ncbi:MAG: ABC transporter permease subunit [Anaerolineae bacterium]|nr:ABC transporter permease subunit [Anaerolineae bacterium]
MNIVLTIAQLTIRESQRRRILWIGLFMGLAFLTVFGLGFHYIILEFERFPDAHIPVREIALALQIAGLYVVYFLTVMLGILIAVAALSGEIDSHIIESIVTKPIRRAEIILGKWLGFAVIIALYTLLLAGGTSLIVYLRSGFVTPNLGYGLLIIFWQGVIAMTLTIIGGTRLSTLANGGLAFMLYGIGFIGGWVEQIGALFRNETAVDLGILSSLIMPVDVLWRHIIMLLTPASMLDSGFDGPVIFVVVSRPSEAMLLYAVFYVFALLLGAVWSFTTRDF